MPTARKATPSCSFKAAKSSCSSRWSAPDAQAAGHGKTDLLDKFVSMRTRRAFKAFLAWGQAAGKVNFEFEPRELYKFPPRKTAAAAKTGAATHAGGAGAVKPPNLPKKAAAKTTTAAPRKTSGPAGKAPSAQLAAVIGTEPVARPEAVKKLWDYIKAHNLQDPRTNAPSSPTTSCAPCSARTASALPS